MESSRYSHGRGGGFIARGAHRLIVARHRINPLPLSNDETDEKQRITRILSTRTTGKRVKKKRKEGRKEKPLRRINEAARRRIPVDEERRRRVEHGCWRENGREKEGCRNLIWTNSSSPLITGGGPAARETLV